MAGEAAGQIVPDRIGNIVGVRRVHVREQHQRPEKQFPVRSGQVEQALPIQCLAARTDQVHHVGSVEALAIGNEDLR